MRGSNSLRGTTPPRTRPRATLRLNGVTSAAASKTGGMSRTEKLTIIFHETLGSLERSSRVSEWRRVTIPTMATPHNNMRVESQTLGRNLLRNTLLGTYQISQNPKRPNKERGDVLRRRRRRNKRW